MSARRVSQKRRRKNKQMDLDINSLLDILVILLVFLLKSYSASQIEISLPKKMEIPVSKSEDYGIPAPTIKVTKDGDIYLNKNLVINKVKRKIDDDGKISQLHEKLADIKNKMLKENQKKDQKSINLVFDKGVKYKDMKLVMHTSSFSGYGKFKFLVQARE